MATKKKTGGKKRVEEKAEEVQEVKVSERRVPTGFLFVLSVVSVFSFFGIAMKTLFGLNIDNYVEILWLVTLGGGMLKESNMSCLIKLKETGFTPENFRGLVVFVIGLLAIITGILMLPQIGITTPALLAIQGIISLVAMIFILIQSIILKSN